MELASIESLQYDDGTETPRDAKNTDAAGEPASGIAFLLAGTDGNETLSLADGQTVASHRITNSTDNVLGGGDTVIITSLAGTNTIDGAAGVDALNMSGLTEAQSFTFSNPTFDATGSTSTTSVTAVETFTGTDRGDTYSFSGNTSGLDLTTITAGSGSDTVQIASGSTVTMSISGVAVTNISAVNFDGDDSGTETLFVSLATGFAGATINSDGTGGCTDTLNLYNVGTNVMSILNTESVTMGTGDNALSLENAVSSIVVNGGTGTNTVQLTTGTHSLGLTAVEVLQSFGGNDTITLTNAQSGLSIAMDAGTDALTLAAGGNTITVTGAETITGGSGNDAVTLGAAQSSGTIDLAGGDQDSLTLAADGNTLTVSNTETVTDGTDAGLYRINDSGDGSSWDSADHVATLEGLDSSDLSGLTVPPSPIS